ncbi:solute carrier organic anion transporter family member 2B1 isoform X1 [Ochotona princeps]|uniref:solute carrier organic anion transporter family member 2B1 isoform X1 n=2 Tax=Ochotona princeps TaxID=9978 RepID=UPI0027154EDB|nr:solute carrier organic anion transporter family member 2B1 isoform X1 [Ochotona princeps]
MGPRIGPAGEEPPTPDKTTVCAEDMAGGDASPTPRDSRPSVFHNIKFFVLCHSLLQLAQLMVSSYLKSSISTVEKRFGLSSQTSGLLAAFNEVGNTTLIVFVSYFGSRVHRPRLIGCGAVLVTLAGLLMTLPHFLSEPYRYEHSNPENTSQDFKPSLCLPTMPAPALASSNGTCSSYTETRHLTMVGIMLTAQTLLGVGGVPIQPFGISYIDDFAHHSNSPLYLGILFAVTMMGPSMSFGLGSLMLRLYVDIDRMPEGGINLTQKDPRWVGAWWLGFLISAGAVALAAIPYFFFPREMPKEKDELHFRRKASAATASSASQDEDSPAEQGPGETQKKQDGLAQIAPDLTILQFIRVFPRVLLRTLRHPIFLLVVLSQVCMSCMAAGMATFLPKFLERQFSITASYANLLIGSLAMPLVIVGIVVGGVLVKRLHMGPLRCGLLCLLSAVLGMLLSLPLFFTGCSNHHIAGIIHQSATQPEPALFPGCMELCSCPADDFNPVCDASTHVEYLTPCHAGCTSHVVKEARERSQVLYTNCSCVPGDHPVLGGSCESPCSSLVLPFMFLVSLSAAVFSITHTPSFMLILRGVKKEDKTLAVGIQFMLLRVLAWMPSPVIHGSAIDTTCVHWAVSCGRRAVCRYYNHDLLRTRFVGLQFFFKAGSLICFALVVAILRQQDKEAGAAAPGVAPASSPALQKKLLVSELDRKREDSRV